MNRPRDNSAFTLIELLAALAIMTAIVSMVYGSYAATAQSLDIHSGRLTCTHRATLVLRLMARQIRCTYAPTTEPNTGDASDVEVRDRESMAASLQTRLANRGRFDGRAYAFRGGARAPRGEILTFATTAGLGTGSGASSGPAQIRYRFDARTGTLSVDRRACLDQFDDADRSASWQPIMQDVTGVDVAFHDGREWQSNWDGTRSRHLPRAVRIAIDVEDEKERPYRFETTIPILRCADTPMSRVKQRSRGGR